MIFFYFFFIPVQIIYAAQLLNLLPTVIATVIRMTQRHLPHFQRRRDTIQALFLISLNKTLVVFLLFKIP